MLVTGMTLFIVFLLSLFRTTKAPVTQRIASLLRTAGGSSSRKRIYGHSRFCNTDFDDKLALLESIRRLNGILFPRLDEFRA